MFAATSPERLPMPRCLTTALLACLAMGTILHAADPKKPEKLPPALQQLLKGSADDFIRRFDKNRDGYLTRDELPPRLAQNFDKLDRNGDGKLDRQEVAQLLRALRQRFGVEPGKPKPGAGPGNPDALVKRWLERMDKNKDGKVSKDEAQGPLARFFDQLDTNRDGFLDRAELRRAAVRILAQRAGNGAPAGPGQTAPRPSGPDFDALDANADGRLTRDELKGTPLAEHFDEIDTNKDGKIDRKEFAAYLKKQAARK